MSIFAAGATSNLVTFQTGDADNEYRATIVLRVSDIFGDYTEVNFSVIVCVLFSYQINDIVFFLIF